MKLFSLLAANKHTSFAAVVYVLAKTGAQLGAVWYPAHAEQFKSTADIIESAAVGYGLLAAGDASKSVTKDEADTQFVKKQDLPASAQPTIPKP